MSKLVNNVREVLKIIKIFPNLQEKKIENIQKIINSNSKTKPKFNMTTKKLFRKQVIISMNGDNETKFIKDSSNHVTNSNKALKNIKSVVMVNFIHQEQSGVTIVINKVTSPSDL